MPKFTFIDFSDRVYSDLKDADGKFVGTVKPGEVYDLAADPGDGRWAKAESAPAKPAPSSAPPAPAAQASTPAAQS